ncbi:MAG: DUF2089 domain-containing protein [Fimbriimonadales bacterium]|nr:DUF2089 domain-containing protein [Fimbriimonadales bacterium]
MSKLYEMPHKDPISGAPLHITELSCEESGVVIRGRFEIPRFARLDGEMSRFLEVFLRCRGVLSCVEKELGVSYPTVRARLDALLQALGLQPLRDARPSAPSESDLEAKRRVLDLLERGEITAEEAKERLKRGVDR